MLNFVGKFVGYCNDFKTELDRCFKAEKDVHRKINLQKARDDAERYKRYCSKIEALEREQNAKA